MVGKENKGQRELDRFARLSQALRENLKRRKAFDRARLTNQGTEDELNQKNGPEDDPT